MRLFFLVLLQWSFLQGAEVKIATYNVENLFDLHRDGHEYKEYIPNTSTQWNQKNYKAKLNNISQVISGINPDIIGLEEIESLQALKDLRKAIMNRGHYYQYYAITKHKNSTVKNALLSKYPIIYSKDLAVTKSFKYRDILEAKISINNRELYIFVNHWKAKSGAESRRIISAKVLKKRVNELGENKNIVILGDLNSHYEEYKTFVKKRKHNDTYGKTGINHILLTLKNNKSVTLNQLSTCNNCLYNLWYEIDKKERWSHKYKSYYEALDHIIINPSLHNKKGIEYIEKSFEVFKPKYLLYTRYKKLYVNRWQMGKKPYKHLGKGYSDHLAIYAKFSVK